MNEQMGQVRIVRPDAAAEHRRREVRAITATIAVICTVAMACAVFPAVDNLVTAAVVTLVASMVGGLLLRWVARRVRWWFEDRADERAAARWRADRAAERAAHAEPVGVA